jgi:hypothetical protein
MNLVPFFLEVIRADQQMHQSGSSDDILCPAGRRLTFVTVSPKSRQQNKRQGRPDLVGLPARCYSNAATPVCRNLAELRPKPVAKPVPVAAAVPISTLSVCQQAFCEGGADFAQQTLAG